MKTPRRNRLGDRSVLGLLILLLVCAAQVVAAQEFFYPRLVTRAPSPQPGSNAFYGVDVLGVDIDNDQVPELAVGAWNEDVNSGQNGFGVVRILSLPDFTQLASLTNPQARQANDFFGLDFFGLALGWGDVDGNGTPELAVGIPGRKSGSQIFAGQIVVYEDGASGAYATIEHPAPRMEDAFGSSIAIADIHANPGDEIVVGVPKRDVTGSGEEGGNEGKVLLFGNVNTRKLLDTLQDPVPGLYAEFGVAVTAGDFNADGQKDIAVGAYGAGDLFEGHVVVFFGPDFDLENLVHTTIEPEDPAFNLGFGKSIAAGDIDGDGIDDLAVGRVGGLNPFSAGGAVDLILGPDFTRRQRVSAPETDMLGFGHSVDLTDLDGDEWLDLAVGAMTSSAPNGVAGAGELVLFTTAPGLGGSSPLVGDLDGNEIRDAFDLFLFASQWGSDQPVPATVDLIPDGIVDKRDAAALAVALRSRDADLNGDGRLTFEDVFQFSTAWNSPRGAVPGTDLNDDGTVEATDLHLFLHSLERRHTLGD